MVYTKLLIFTLILLSNISELNAETNQAKFYGKIDVSFQNTGAYAEPLEGLEREYHIQGNGSRVGFKFSTNMSESLDFFLNLESALDFNATDSNQVDFSNRNSFLGIAGDWGRLLLGQNDSPLKMSQGNIDLFSDSDSQMWPLQKGENRVSDVLQFTSANFDGFVVNSAIVKNTDSSDNELGFSNSIAFENEDFYSAFAVDKAVLNYDIIRWVNSLYYDQLTVSFLVQNAKSLKTKKTEVGYTASSSYEISEFTLKFQLTKSDEIILNGQFVSFGMDWKYSDELLLYTIYTQRSSTQENNDDELFSLGMKYQF